jgi:hypothetical protein
MTLVLTRVSGFEIESRKQEKLEILQVQKVQIDAKSANWAQVSRLAVALVDG